MATYRVLDPKGEVVATKDIESADDAHAWFVDQKADNSELGWRMEVQHDGEWHFFDDSEGIEARCLSPGSWAINTAWTRNASASCWTHRGRSLRCTSTTDTTPTTPRLNSS